MIRIGKILFLIIVGFLICDYFGIPLRNIVLPVYRLLPGFWWMVIGLGLVIFFLLLVINGVRRYHQRTVSRIYEDNKGITKEYAESDAKIELWALFKGRYDGIYALLENRSWNRGDDVPLKKAEIEYAEAEFRGILQDRLGPDWIDNYLGRLGPIPDSIRGQARRMEAHGHQFHRLIQAERGHQQAIATKANWQREQI